MKSDYMKFRAFMKFPPLWNFESGPLRIKNLFWTKKIVIVVRKLTNQSLRKHSFGRQGWVSMFDGPPRFPDGKQILLYGTPLPFFKILQIFISVFILCHVFREWKPKYSTHKNVFMSTHRWAGWELNNLVRTFILEQMLSF